MEKKMRAKYDICVIGMGPVGAVSGVCFAKQGFSVIGVDINEARVSAFLRGAAPFHEPGINELIKETQQSGNFFVVSDISHAVSNARIIMLAVGTPTPESGEPDLSQLGNAAASIGECLKNSNNRGAIIVLRSTVPPGTMRNYIANIIADKSGFRLGEDFFVASNPEFLREGKAIADFFNTGRIVIGSDYPEVSAQIEALYRDVAGERIFTSLEAAEFAKYVDNTWHALKVCFANEIGRVCKGFGGDPMETAKIFLADKKLNISEYYLKPGFAFGGSCLPKDVRGLNNLAEKLGISIPVIKSILPSNREQIEEGVKRILSRNPRKVGVLGVSFKEKIDDLRESPSLEVAAILSETGIEVKAYDEFFASGTMVKLPNGSGNLAMENLQYLTDSSDVLAIFHKSYEAVANNMPEDKIVNLTTLI